MIDLATVKKVADLARLSGTAEELAAWSRDLERVLEHVDRLAELDVSKVPPLVHAAGSHDVFREDVPGPTLPLDEALGNAPSQEDACFRVPRIIGDA
jgi:aspartyl-tRNA(Asn)/glutamyl-tRNA(Gln) amidotransferase subunit C